ncbi:2Fe-2S iron-sulfur cluster-binding protein [Sulfuriferula nivalis]|uniref:Ferredoxin n=1 Tax=Sulfuriferula nivalis TaxID=2675298 RepID=A0A809RLS1_9PROT|nr:2Fe-2S iron-sulfur cluster-binding protein [Sulfuriferula nivalis]BBO99730.1 ferredoxin [Sulfuriferula nivalis]
MAKAKIKFADVNVTVTVPVGTRIIEISEKVGSYIAYNCREGDCGSCLFTVLDGAENLSTPSSLEEATLFAHFQEVLDGWRSAGDLESLQSMMRRENFAGKTCRLACQTQVFGDATVAPI